MGTLFFTNELSNALRANEAALASAVHAATDADLADPESFKQRLMVKFRVDKIVLGSPTLERRRGRVDLRRSREADLYLDPGENQVVEGSYALWTIPFQGQAELFSLRPSNFTNDPPRGEISGNSVVFEYPALGSAEAVKAEFDEEHRKLRQFAAWQAYDIDRFMNDLPSAVEKLVGSRTARKLREDEFFEKLR